MAARFKTFTAGAVLTASEVNTFLAKQAVISCDSSADYPSAPVEGMVVYDVALDAYLGYTGAAWRVIASLSAGSVVNVNYTVAAETNTASTSMADYLTLGSITVPSWAIRANVTMAISGMYAVANTWFGQFRVKVGTATGNTTGQIGVTTTRTSATLPSLVTLSGSGSQNVILEAQRVAGGETLRSDGGTRVLATVTFLGT
jgi:hypothetical protein